MKKISLIILITMLLFGCNQLENKPKTVSELSNCKSNLSKWLQDCTHEIVRTQSNEIQSFNSIGSNDTSFIPTSNPAEEIFQKCQSIKPLSAKDEPVYKKCLEQCISEIKSIDTNTTRGEVNKLLQQNGGLSSPQAAIYSHLECDVLKVRVEFEFQRDEDGRAKYNENDKVKAVSMPYLGFFISD